MRSAAASRIKNEFSDRIDFVRHDTSVACDIGILIEGCSACCVVRDELAPCKKLIEISSEKDIGTAIAELEKML